jgi:hypothetical protein
MPVIDGAAALRHGLDQVRGVAPSYFRSLRCGWSGREQYRDVAAFCLFIGYPRSGHSLVGSLLNAHPEVVISHELDVLRYVGLRFRRQQLFHLILERDRDFASTGRAVGGGFDYNVPDEWQGRYRRILVIGDKRGNSSIRRLDEDSKLFSRLERTVAVPVRVIHLTRNPFDNIATMAQRSGCGLDKAIDRYLRLCGGVERIRERHPHAVLDRAHEDLLAEPAAFLIGICDFLGVDAPPSYLKHCAAIVYDKPNRSRSRVDWTDDGIARVDDAIERFSFLTGYSYGGR